MKKKNVFILIAIVFFFVMLIPTWISALKSCTCYKASDAKNACATKAEYLKAVVLSGTCPEGSPSCHAKIKVTCIDLSEEKIDPGNPANKYTKDVWSWGDNCAACGGSGGGGSGGAGFEDLPGDYGNWHDPNWY